MAEATRSAEALIAQMKDAARKEVTEALRPIVAKLTQAVSDLDKALAATKQPVRRGPKPGRARKAAAPQRGRKPRLGAKTEAMKDAIKKVLGSGPMKLVGIQNELLKDKAFKKRSAKSVYVQIIRLIKRIPEVTKNADGLYALK
ncbi:MAG: hypothetical protein M1457_01915 [bacterium]|nr:hypothetical protein [bacterium]